jgi:hypothetical protein
MNVRSCVLLSFFRLLFVHVATHWPVLLIPTVKTSLDLITIVTLSVDTSY